LARAFESATSTAEICGSLGSLDVPAGGSPKSRGPLLFDAGSACYWAGSRFDRSVGLRGRFCSEAGSAGLGSTCFS